MIQENDIRALAARAKMHPEDFERIAAFAHTQAGLQFCPQKAPMMESRLVKRLKALGIPSFSDYCTLIEDPEQTAERQELISALTTNVTSFFREPHHFETLQRDIMPALVSRLKNGEPVRIWSAGCSKGHEPYTLGMLFREELADIARYDFRILATDIDTRILQYARQGLYTEIELSGLSPERLSKHFVPEGNERFRISPEIRSLVRFNKLNLLEPWPMNTTFDAVFCRNVVIYFDQATQDKLWPRFQSATKTGGWLFIGHSERLTPDAAPLYQASGMTSYHKSGPASP